MLEIKFGNNFKKEVKKLSKRGKDLNKLWSLIELLQHKKPLHAKYKNHKLTGNWLGFWDCHIEPDWLLLYKIENNILYLASTGSHSDLF